MGLYMFDIILIILAIVIIIQLVYNNSIIVNTKSQCNESMDNISSEEIYSRESEENCSGESEEVLNYNDGKYRDPFTKGLDRTDETKKWYHYVNRLITNDTSIKEQRAVEDIQNIIKSSNVTDIDSSKTKNSGRLVFDDNYEGLLSSDPFETDDKIQLPNNSTTNALRTRYSEEKYVDAYGNQCTRADNDVEMKRYIRDFVLDGTNQCGCIVDNNKPVTEFTSEDINKYRDDYMKFNDKINSTSAPTEDPVDRINQTTMAEGVKAKGQTIADYYDNIVGGRVSNLNGSGYIMGTSVPANRCVRPPVFDNEAGVPHGFYTGSANAGSKYIMRDNWIYSNENPNNGGVLYDGISANDPLIDNDRMLDF